MATSTRQLSPLEPEKPVVIKHRQTISFATGAPEIPKPPFAALQRRTTAPAPISASPGGSTIYMRRNRGDAACFKIEMPCSLTDASRGSALDMSDDDSPAEPRRLQRKVSTRQPTPFPQKVEFEFDDEDGADAASDAEAPEDETPPPPKHHESYLDCR